MPERAVRRLGENGQGEATPAVGPEYGYFPNATLKVFLTDICNLSCEGCFMESSLQRLVKNSYNRLPNEKVMALMAEAKSAFGTEMVEFSGGEVTLELSDLKELVRVSKGMGFKTRIVTNGTILGREGTYNENLTPYLPIDLASVTPQDAVYELKQSGLDSVILSIDSMHNVRNKDLKPDRLSAKAPVSTLANALRILLDAGYGADTGGGLRSDHSLRIGVTAAGSEYEESYLLVDQVFEEANRGFRFLGKEGRYGVWLASDGKKVYVHRNETADVGFGQRLKDKQLVDIADSVYDRSCYVFSARSIAAKGTGGVHQEICVFPDGVVSTCAYRSHVIGNHNKQSLTDIVRSVNDSSIKPLDEVELGVLVLRELFKIAEEVGGRGVWGEAYRRVVKVNPDLKLGVESFKSHTAACGGLTKNRDFLDALIAYRN